MCQCGAPGDAPTRTRPAIAGRETEAEPPDGRFHARRRLGTASGCEGMCRPGVVLGAREDAGPDAPISAQLQKKHKKGDEEGLEYRAAFNLLLDLCFGESLRAWAHCSNWAYLWAGAPHTRARALTRTRLCARGGAVVAGRIRSERAPC